MNPAFWISRLVRNPNITIVQIGSNHGVRGDPIHQLLKDNPCWRALLVRPVPCLFERLRSNYGDDPRFRFVDAAVNNGDRVVLAPLPTP